MRWVHVILLLAIMVPGCRTGEPGVPAPLHGSPDFVPEEEPPPVERPIPKGFVGDPSTSYFHRMECPLVEGIPPAVRHYFAYPEDALNARYHPCDRCEPMSGLLR